MEIATKQKVYKMKQSWRQASMQVSNSSVARPWKLEQNTSGQASRAGFEAGLEGLKPMEIEAKQYDKEGALFWSSKRKKKQARKNGPPQFKLPLAAVAGQISFNLKINASTDLPQWRGQNLISRGSTFWPLFKHVSFFSVQRQMALARSFIKPERQLHFVNSPN